jgi:hypothetical protein
LQKLSLEIGGTVQANTGEPERKGNENSNLKERENTFMLNDVSEF